LNEDKSLFHNAKQQPALALIKAIKTPKTAISV